MVFCGATESFWSRGGGRRGGLFVICPRSRGPRPSIRRRREIAAGNSFVGKLGTGTTTAGSVVRGSFKVSLGGYRDASPFITFEASLDTATHLRSYAQENSRTVTIDSREVSDGKYTLGWHAWDAAGNEGIIKRSLIVDNKTPTVSIIRAPKNGAKVKKKFAIAVKASDTYGIAKVQLLVNGKLVATDYRAGYALTVNPKKYGKKFTVQLRAYDKAGNVKYAAKRTYRR